MTNSVSKVLGSARYEARWVQRSILVKLTARGLLPCSNYIAQLEQRPERVVPSMWNMVFFVPDECEKGLECFEVSAFMANDTGADAIVVHDAKGMQEVPILQAFDVAPDEDLCIVYAKLQTTDDGHKGCVVVPADSLVSAIHYHAFGPAPRAECEAFVQAECSGPAQGFRLAGGEIPWPLLA